MGGADIGQHPVEGLDAHSLADRADCGHTQAYGRILDEGGALISRPARLHGEVIDVTQCPDLVPPLAIAAAFAEGQTHITGAARLRIKESDRLHALAQNLAALGIRVEELPDGLIIRGGQPAGGVVDSFECVDKSYPAFYQDYVALGGKII